MMTDDYDGIGELGLQHPEWSYLELCFQYLKQFPGPWKMYENTVRNRNEFWVCQEKIIEADPDRLRCHGMIAYIRDWKLTYPEALPAGYEKIYDIVPHTHGIPINLDEPEARELCDRLNQAHQSRT